MWLSIRNVSRFSSPLLALALLGLWVTVLSFRLTPGWVALAAWFGVVATALWLSIWAFRCPRCHASTVATSGKWWWGAWAAPFWTPRRCPQCHLEFRDRT